MFLYPLLCCNVMVVFKSDMCNICYFIIIFFFVYFYHFLNILCVVFLSFFIMSHSYINVCKLFIVYQVLIIAYIMSRMLANLTFLDMLLIIFFCLFVCAVRGSLHLIIMITIWSCRNGDGLVA